MGAKKKFGMSFETREIKNFWRDIPGFCRDIPGVPEKFEKKKFVLNSRLLRLLPQAQWTHPGNIFRSRAQPRSHESLTEVDFIAVLTVFEKVG